MNDIDFALSISPAIGLLYKQAKDSHAELPGHSLVQLRGLCRLICDLIAQNENPLAVDKSDLESKISHLHKMRWIDNKTKFSLNQLRQHGNRGAHPEQFMNADDDLKYLALKSLEIARGLLEHTYQRLYPYEPLAKYEVSDSSGTSLKDFCYQAMIEADTEARYGIGKMLLAKAGGLLIDAQKDAESGGTGIVDFEYNNILAQARFWFKLAADCNHPPSLYEYGFALFQGFEGEDMKASGENFIYRASQFGNADANAFIGRCFLNGSQTFEVDLVEARKCFELAATEDHPVALANLGTMYDKGWGGPANSKAAFDYTYRSATAGYPTGQYNIFIHYFNGRGVETDETVALKWLTKAADQGFPEAMIVLARFISNGRVHGKVLADADILYQRCFFDDLLGNEARYELVLLYRDKWPELDKLILAASLLQECYEREGCNTELAEKCWGDAPSLVKLLKDGFISIAKNADLLKAAIIVLNYFDLNGHPYKKRSERNSDYIKKINDFRAAQNVGGPQLAKKTLEFIPPGIPRLALIKSSQLKQKNEKIGRNEPCTCGSGKKYKVCCLD